MFLLYGPGEHGARLVAPVIDRLIGASASRDLRRPPAQLPLVTHVADALAALVAREDVQAP
jgi:hypothetical protein